MKPIIHDGREMPIGHLAPMAITCPCKPIGRELAIRVVFANHCYTESFVHGAHAREQIILYDAPDRPRVFCPIRYELSHRLPQLIDELPTKKVHQTAQARNYVYVVPLEIEGQVYEIYFMLQRAQPDDDSDLRLTVESAYPVPAPSVLPKRPGSIRFTLLAHKVLLKQPIRFAVR